MKLNDRQCKTAQGKDKPYKLADGKGLYLEVMPKGARYWRLKYRIHNKEKRLALGVYPDVTLKEARDKTEAARKQIADGIDPSFDKQVKKAQAQTLSENTFQAIALEWHDVKSSQWSANYARKIQQGLEKNIFPFIGKRPITEIEPPELLACLKQIEHRGSYDIAGRTKQICGQVFKYGIQTGRCQRDSSADLKGALKAKKTEHFRTIDFKEVPAFMEALRTNKARLFERTLNAVWLSLYTFLRPKEIRLMRWDYIDFENKVCEIPFEIMKSKRAHIVPLSSQAIAVLQAQR
jgi:integrase